MEPNTEPTTTGRPSLGDVSEMTYETVRALATLLGHASADVRSARAWAAHQLGVASTQMTAVQHEPTPIGALVLGYLIGLELEKYRDVVAVGSPGDAEPPTWTPMDLGDGNNVSVPAKLVLHFPAGTLAPDALCLSMVSEPWDRRVTIFVREEHRGSAEAVIDRLLHQSRGEANPMRGKHLEAQAGENGLVLRLRPTPQDSRRRLVLPDEIWAEVDVFTSAATTRREILRTLGLGTNRGLLLAGPPGVGKTHLTRVIAAELVGDFTIIVADANAVGNHIRDIYLEVDALGPTVVVLEDIDLLIGHRAGSAAPNTLAEFLSSLDGVHQHSDVLTIATTNDASAIDPAAQRSARLDSVLEIPRPDVSSRARILRSYLAPLKLDIDVDPVATALDGCTGSDAREVVRRAVLEFGDTFDQAQLLEIAHSGRWRPTVSIGQYL